MKQLLEEQVLYVSGGLSPLVSDLFSAFTMTTQLNCVGINPSFPPRRSYDLLVPHIPPQTADSIGPIIVPAPGKGLDGWGDPQPMLT